MLCNVCVIYTKNVVLKGMPVIWVASGSLLLQTKKWFSCASCFYTFLFYRLYPPIGVLHQNKSVPIV